MSADATVQKIILHQNTLTTPAWSPDGNRIAFINENSDLAIIDVTGENYRVLNTIPGACLQPVWSPDGKYILYNRAVYYN
jgi:Tol biopolymer transport system component